MQREAIYENGKLELSRQVHFKHARVRLIVEIPDDQVLQDDAPAQTRTLRTEPPAAQSAGSVSDQITAILAPWRDQLKTLEPIKKDIRRELAATEWEEHHCAQH